MPRGVEKAKSAGATTFSRAQSSSLRSRTGLMKAVTSLGRSRKDATENSCADAGAEIKAVMKIMSGSMMYVRGVFIVAVSCG